MANGDRGRLVQRQLYLPEEDVDRIAALVDAVGCDPEMRALVRNDSDAARLVVTTGLAVLEQRYGVIDGLLPAGAEELEG